MTHSGDIQQAGKTARRIRTASRNFFWLSIFVGMLVSMLSPPAAVLVFCTSICALPVYCAALILGQKQVNSEFTEFLISRQMLNYPVVLFLRSFNTAQSGLLHRLLLPLLSFILLMSGDMPDDLAPYDIEEELDAAIGSKAVFVAIGNKRISYGSAKITVSDKEWQGVFRQLTRSAWLIFMMPGPTEATLWELSEIIRSPDLLKKTIFLMPPTGAAEIWLIIRAFFVRSICGTKHAYTISGRWAEVAASVQNELEISLPRYNDDGGCFRFEVNNRSTSRLASLEPFVRALNKYTESHQDTLSVDELWSSLN